jgi:hypothetical protein
VRNQQHNRRKGRVHAHIERLFAPLKKWQHSRRVRSLGLARNQLERTLKAGADNLNRLAGIIELQRAQVKPNPIAPSNE